MIINRLRIQEEHPMTGPTRSWPLPTIDFNLNFMAGENGYILKDSTGLGPPALTSIVEGFDIAGQPVLTAVPTEKREIVLKVGLDPGLGQDRGALRDALYRFIGRSIYVKLMDDTIVIAHTIGYVKSIEPTYFSNNPDLLITIECPDPTGTFLGDIGGVVPPLTLQVNRPVINYTEGTAPTGFQFGFTVTATGTDFSMSEYSEFWYSGDSPVNNEFTVLFSFQVGDVFFMDTNPTSRFIQVSRVGDIIDLAGYVTPGAVWPKLYPGVNTFLWNLNATWVTLASIFMEYSPRFWGV